MNMAVGGSRGTDGKISPWRMTCERNLGTNGPSSARPRLNEGHKNGSTGFLVLTTAIEDVFSSHDKILPRLFVAERIPGHMRASKPSASGSRSRTQLFGQSGRENGKRFHMVAE